MNTNKEEIGMVENLVGQKFGKLTVIKRVENDKFNKAQWLCTCECAIVHGRDFLLFL